ncbi:MAG: putative peptidoglycan glycosyltransferase FtsW [Anaerolineales bacterium]
MFRAMGERTSIRGTGQRAVRHNGGLRLGIDVPLLLVVMTLLIFGLVMVYSASYDYSLAYYGDAYRIFQRQVIFMLIGMGTAVLLTFLDYHVWQRLAVPVGVITIVGLVAVLLASNVLNNAARTLWEGSIQPSELAKLITVVYLSVWLYSKREFLQDVTLGLIPLGIMLGGLGFLIYLQPDLSAVITIALLGAIMFFLAGADLRQIGFLIVFGLIFGWLLVQVSSTGSERMSAYLAGLKNPLNSSYHVRRSLEAFVNGGWFGVGIGMSETKLTGLPVPQTDSIYAVIGEETGFFGAAALVFLYILLLWRGLTIAQRARDGLGALMAGGLTLWLALEAFVNMAVMVNVLPFAGNALPFISAGGSNLSVSLAAVGILLNISRLSNRQDEKEGNFFSAVVDLRRRDRRRGVSRSRRSSGVGRSG